MILSIAIKWLNSPIWPIDRTLTGTTTQGQIGHGSNGNEDVLYIPQSSRDSTSNAVQWTHPGYSLEGGDLFPCIDAVRIFYSFSQLGCCLRPEF